MLWRNSRRESAWACTLLLALCPASACLADVFDGTEVYTYDSRATGANPAGPFATGEPNSFVLPKFDDTVKVYAFGEWHPRNLVAVTLSVEAFVRDGYLLLDNEDDELAMAIEVTIGAQLRVSSNTPGAPLVVVTFPRDSTSGVLAADTDGAPDFIGPDAIAAVADGDADANHMTLDVADDPVKQAPWVGAGQYVTWDFDANSRLFAEIRPSVNPVALLQSPLYEFVAEVRYHWQVAPEPVSGTLLALSGAAVLLRRRRRRVPRGR